MPIEIKHLTAREAAVVRAVMAALEVQLNAIREDAEAAAGGTPSPVTVALLGVENAVARVVDEIDAEAPHGDGGGL